MAALDNIDIIRVILAGTTVAILALFIGFGFALELLQTVMLHKEASRKCRCCARCGNDVEPLRSDN